MDVPTSFFLIGGIIFIGFLGSLFFQKTKIPDVLMLMILGMLIGPVFHVVEPASFSGITPYFAALALIILLFEGGLGLNLFKVLNEISKATGFTVMIFLFTVAITGFVMSTFFSWNVYHGFLLGAVLGGSSSAIVIALLNRAKVPGNVKTLLTLESALTDVLCIIVTISLIDVILSNSLSLSAVGNSLLGSFSIAAVIASIFGIVWFKLLKNFGGFEYGYLLTLAVTFILYAFVESIKANGAVAALVFGLMLSNAPDVAKMLRLRGDYAIKRAIITFHREIAFFIKTFFFVYVGILIDLNSITNISFVFMSLSVVFGIVLARRLGVCIFGRFSEDVRENSPIINGMMPRGLAAAVLASLPASMGLQIDGFVDIAFLGIIATNIITTVSTYYGAKDN
ncbi:MAG: cation:proton antiporter [Nanoarchaeota archaeon]|nr:cation:proton antiporter [Nanoarchaeota archaeon]MBU4300627.1 cation:proton antiporter [Nanoarchaeota archaeon]MBU4452180.1 cation:proton antiporter [Nanoarchaeota archaeon]MCG2724220.1 cation:proton antiporter [archaeon]